MSAKVLLAFFAAAALSGCRGKGVEVPEIEDKPAIGAAAIKNIPEMIPGYGIVEGARVVVSIEAADSPRVHEGQSAWVRLLPSTAPVSCRVTRMLRSASTETHQSLAWLESVSGRPLPPNSFAAASIEVARRAHALVVPRAAVMVRNGRTVVLRVTRAAGGKVAYDPAEVTMGVESGGDVEILSGLKPGEEIVTSAGLGLLFPEFKAASD